jgi:hypothetical protein
MDEYHNEEYDLIEHDDYWLIPLRGTRVAKIIIDLALRIEFIDASENETLIWIGGSIRIRSQGNEYMLHGDNPKELAPILELWGSAVDSAAAHKDGRLEVKFRDGSDFCAYPLPATESWGVTDNDGFGSSVCREAILLCGSQIRCRTSNKNLS